MWAVHALLVFPLSLTKKSHFFWKFISIKCVLVLIREEFVKQSVKEDRPGLALGWKESKVRFVTELPIFPCFSSSARVWSTELRMSRRVAVVGAGSSGLACIKCCLDEGLEPVCFESSDDIGGLWRFKVSFLCLLVAGSFHVTLSEPPGGPRRRTQNQNGPASTTLSSSTPPRRWCASATTPSLHTSQTSCTTPSSWSTFGCMRTTSNSTSTFVSMWGSAHLLFSDHSWETMRRLYLSSCAQTKVLQIKQRADFSRSGQWDVETENKDGKREKHIFDAVMICIGHHCQPHLPLHDFPGNVLQPSPGWGGSDWGRLCVSRTMYSTVWLSFHLNYGSFFKNVYHWSFI